ncbi:MAG TPA: cellulase family glycosylhydrolase, partial [Actinomycetota bacterium]
GAPIDPQRGAADVWRMMAGRYRANPMVIGADLLTEPDCPSRSGQGVKLDPLYSRLTRAIRSANPKIMIVFEDYIAAIVQKSGSGVTLSPDRNAMYAFHLYRPDWALAKGTLDSYIRHGRDLRVPPWLGEFDAFGANRRDKPPPGDWQALTMTLFEYLRAHDVSGWAYWAYRGTGSVFEGDGTTVDTELIRSLQTGF